MLLKQLVFLTLLNQVEVDQPVATNSLLPAKEISPAKKHSLAAAEKMLVTTEDLEQRSQILLRWVKLKDEILGDSATQDDKKAIVEKLRTEIEVYERANKFDLNPFYRQIAYRIMDLENTSQSAFYFNKMTSRNPDDELAFGDALMANQMATLAFEAYQRASVKEELKPVATYKKAWAYTELHQFKEALETFDQVLMVRGENFQRLRESTFRDRIIPYVENFVKAEFDQPEADRLRAAAEAVLQTPMVTDATESLFQTGLMEVVKRFSEKGEIQRAESAYKLITQKDKLSLAFLEAGPLWLKTYRAALDHKGFEDILRRLPENSLEAEKYARLSKELIQSSKFYETLVVEGKETKQKNILLLTYAKLFELFPKAEADEARIQYSAHLLKDKNDERALSLLKDRSYKAGSLEDTAQKLEAEIRLKNLERLYASVKDPKSAIAEEFSSRLQEALIEKKIYLRSDLGVKSENLFEGLARMLIGGLKKNSQSETFSAILDQVISAYPYSKTSVVYQDLTSIQRELRFNRLTSEIVGAKVASNPEEKLEELAKQFFILFQESGKQIELAEKSLENSVLLSSTKILSYCDEYQKAYPKKFTVKAPGKQKIFDICQKSAEQNFDLAREQSYWLTAEKDLNADQKVKLGLLELALHKKSGRDRIEKSKSRKAEAVLAFWDQDRPEIITKDEKLQALKVKVDQFSKNLKAIRFQEIAKIVPEKVNAFETLDRALVAYFQTKAAPESLGKIYSLRAKLADAMSSWIGQLPEPKLKPTQLEEYKVNAAKVVSVWKNRARERAIECSQSAYTFSYKLKSDDLQTSSGLCAEETNFAIEAEHLRRWQQTRIADSSLLVVEDPKDLEAKKFLEAAEKGTLQTEAKKYFLLKASDLANSPRLQASIHLALAKIFNQDSYWIEVHSLDGNLKEPIQYLKEKAAGNPFYSRLYAKKLELIENNQAFEEKAKVASPESASEESSKN